MAAVTESLGTAIVYGDSGGTSPSVTDIITLTGLASAAARMGASHDLGSSFTREIFVSTHVETGTAPTAGLTVEIYLAFSWDNTNWPGKVTGSDAAYPATVSANKLQLGNPAITLTATNDTNTILKQELIRMPVLGRYVAPVVVNLLGQAFRATTNSRVIIIPINVSVV